MTNNLNKTKQLVFRRPNLCFVDLPPCLPNIDVVDSVKLLGVYVNAIFGQVEHVKYILSFINMQSPVFIS